MAQKRAAYITGNATGQIPQPSNGQFLKRNASTYLWEQGGSSFSEALTISSNGQTSFTLNKSPVDGYADLYLNQLKLETNNYSLGGTGSQTVTYTGSYAIQTTDRLEARYLIANVPLTGGGGGGGGGAAVLTDADIDFSIYNVGAFTGTLPTNMTYTRASTNETVQTSDATLVTGLSTNIAGIGKRDASGLAGLSVDEASNNKIIDFVNPVYTIPTDINSWGNSVGIDRVNGTSPHVFRDTNGVNNRHYAQYFATGITANVVGKFPVATISASGARYVRYTVQIGSIQCIADLDMQTQSFLSGVNCAVTWNGGVATCTPITGALYQNAATSTYFIYIEISDTNVFDGHVWVGDGTHQVTFTLDSYEIQNNPGRDILVFPSAGSATYTNGITGPDGIGKAQRIQTPSGGSTDYFVFGTGIPTSKKAASMWLKTVGSGGAANWLFNDGTIYADGTATTNTWAKHVIKSTTAGTGILNFFGPDGRDWAVNGGVVAGARDVYTDFMQVEYLPYSTEFTPNSTRPEAVLSDVVDSTIKCIEITLRPKAISTEYVTPYILYADAQNYISYTPSTGILSAKLNNIDVKFYHGSITPFMALNFLESDTMVFRVSATGTTAIVEAKHNTGAWVLLGYASTTATLAKTWQIVKGMSSYIVRYRRLSTLPADPNGVLVIGNSLSASPGANLTEQTTWTYYLAQAKLSLNIHNASCGGIDTSQLITRFDILDKNLIATCKTVIIWELGNDLVYGPTPGNATNALSRLATLVAKARLAGATKVITLNLPTRSDITAGALETARNTINNTLAINAGDIYGDVIVDLTANFPNYLDTVKYQADGIHLTASGQALLANTISNIFETTAGTYIISPALITAANTNNYTTPDWSIATHVRLSSSGDTTITGFVNYAAITQRTLINVGSYNITLTNNDVLSTLGNRIKIPGGGSLILEPDDAVTVFYDIVSAVWRVI